MINGLTTRERAIERIAVQHERTVGVLEAFDRRLDRIDARLYRVEAHLGIPVTPSAIPAAPASPQGCDRNRRVEFAILQQREGEGS